MKRIERGTIQIQERFQSLGEVVHPGTTGPDKCQAGSTRVRKTYPIQSERTSKSTVPISAHKYASISYLLFQSFTIMTYVLSMSYRSNPTGNPTSTVVQTESRSNTLTTISLKKTFLKERQHAYFGEISLQNVVGSQNVCGCV